MSRMMERDRASSISNTRMTPISGLEQLIGDTQMPTAVLRPSRSDSDQNWRKKAPPPESESEEDGLNEQEGAIKTKGQSTATYPPAPIQPPGDVRILTWNIDGLDTEDVEDRTVAVIDLIITLQPDVVLLQEVVPASAWMLLVFLKRDYLLIPDRGGMAPYFIALLMRRKSGTVPGSWPITSEPFKNSKMGRGLLSVQACVNGVDMTLLTGHLESMKAESEERKHQLKMAFDLMKEAPAEHSVVFAGDTNLRDYEVDQIGGLPENTCDVWEEMGSRHDTKYTWDLKLNDNKERDFVARCRFDRVYFRNCETEDSQSKLKPIGFHLVGIERIEEGGCFPSDHWGILTDYRKQQE